MRWRQNGARWRRWPAGPTTGSTCPLPLVGTCGRSSPTTGRSCWERSPCGASWCSWSPACSCPCGSRRACRSRRTRAPTPSCAAYRCRMPMPRRCDISFDVRGGLLIRQIHHWAAMVFIAGMLVHLIRVFVTGAFRKPREVTWLIGGTMLLLGVLEGFAGYSLPDDLLSGTGLRIADGIVKATPVVGSYLSFLGVRRRVPRHLRDPAALHRARPADPGSPARPRRRAPAPDRLPQAHAVGRARSHREERRRLPVPAGRTSPSRPASSSWCSAPLR